MKKIVLFNTIVFLFLSFIFSGLCLAEEKKFPITVNGDQVEFVSQGREVVAEGNVEVFYKDSWLKCDKVRVFIDEKIAIAEGNVRFSREDKEEFQGDVVVYDFGDQSGTIIDPNIQMAPYFAVADSMDKLPDGRYVMSNTKISTCDLPHPHWFMSCRTVSLDQNDMLTANSVGVSILDKPVLYMPSYSQKITDKRPRFMIIPGYKKDFGMMLFGSWRYYLNENARGVIHGDWYQNQGLGKGIDLNYDTKLFGLGNIKYYRIDEVLSSQSQQQGDIISGSRSKVEFRHRWDPSSADTVIMEFFKESDANFRKDFFLREYEKQTDPKSFFLYSHVFPNANLSLLAEPRVNKFVSTLQKLPELKYETVNQRLSDTRFYFKNTSTMSNLSNTTANLSGTSAEVTRFDSSNQLSYIFRFMGLDFNPYVGHQDTYYSKQIDKKEDVMRGMFFSGIDVSTRLYKTFDVNTDFMNLNINKLRHVLVPSVQYRYQHEPTVSQSRLQQFDSIDALDSQSRAILSIENKFQTKRDDVPVDLARLLLTTDYYFDPNDTLKAGFQTYSYELEFKPYSWWEFDSKGTFDAKMKVFRTVDADLWGNAGKGRLSLGYRYKYNESSQITAGFNYPLNPFWKLDIYERFESKTGEFVEQEYRFTRDLHCWLVQFIINDRQDEGLTFYIEFTLKAFPEIGINAQKTISEPRTKN